MPEQTNQPKITSIFRSGESTTTQTQFTNMWITLINTLERSKNFNLPKQS